MSNYTVVPGGGRQFPYNYTVTYNGVPAGGPAGPVGPTGPAGPAGPPGPVLPGIDQQMTQLTLDKTGIPFPAGLTVFDFPLGGLRAGPSVDSLINFAGAINSGPNGARVDVKLQIDVGAGFQDVGNPAAVAAQPNERDTFAINGKGPIASTNEPGSITFRIIVNASAAGAFFDSGFGDVGTGAATLVYSTLRRFVPASPSDPYPPGL